MAKTPKITRPALPSSKVDIALTAGSVEPAMKDAAAKSTKLYKVPVDKIMPIPGFNVRVESPDYIAHRDTLAQSIKANGFDQTQPLAGYVAKTDEGNVIYVTSGHTRLAAVQKLNAEAGEGEKIDTLPVLVHPTATSLTDLTVALHTSNNGRPLSPFELGVVVKRLLKEDGADKAKIAERLAVTPRYLDDVLLLVNGPKAVREAVLDGKVSSTLAIQELRAAGDKPEKAAEKIAAAVEKAAPGKRVTKKALGPKMKNVKSTVSVAEGTDMKEIVKAVAALVRKAIPASADGDGDDAIKLASVGGTIKLVVQVPDDTPAKAEKKPTAKKDKAPAKSEKKADAEPKADKPKRTRKAKAEPAPEPEGDDENLSADGDDDLGIPGAEATSVEDEALDMPAPPAVKNGEGVADDADDI